MSLEDDLDDTETWIKKRIGMLPKSSLGWFRAGVGFHNRKKYNYAIYSFKKAIDNDPTNYNAYQVLARTYIAVNKKKEAIECLKKSVKLDNPSDWQLLIELTGGEKENAIPEAPQQS